MDGIPGLLYWAPISLFVTWWVYFRKRVAIQVVQKTKTVVLVAPLRRRATGYGPFYEEDRFLLTDANGRTWIVDQATFSKAQAGDQIELRQWVSEWRAVGRLSRYLTTK